MKNDPKKPKKPNPPNVAQKPENPPNRKPDPGHRGPGIYKSFVHWRTGKRYYAEDYGHGGWPIGNKNQ